mmetsp:Transcript_23364/g.30357  ORF Transcript_23364/g.30357 Transcript_23364/m.30357 type:complete len:298 (-) Transcript_23364:19-912(-)
MEKGKFNEEFRRICESFFHENNHASKEVMEIVNNAEIVQDKKHIETGKETLSLNCTGRSLLVNQLGLIYFNEKYFITEEQFDQFNTIKDDVRREFHAQQQKQRLMMIPEMFQQLEDEKKILAHGKGKAVTLCSNSNLKSARRHFLVCFEHFGNLPSAQKLLSGMVHFIDFQMKHDNVCRWEFWCTDLTEVAGNSFTSETIQLLSCVMIYISPDATNVRNDDRTNSTKIILQCEQSLSDEFLLALRKILMRKLKKTNVHAWPSVGKFSLTDVVRTNREGEYATFQSSLWHLEFFKLCC